MMNEDKNYSFIKPYFERMNNKNTVQLFIKTINKYSLKHQSKIAVSFRFSYFFYYLIYFIFDRAITKTNLFQLIYKYKFSEEYYFFDNLVFATDLYKSNNQKYIVFGYYSGMNLLYAIDLLSKEIVLIDK